VSGLTKAPLFSYWRDSTRLHVTHCIPKADMAKRKVLSPLVGERQREGMLALCAICFSPSPQPSPLKGEGVRDEIEILQ